MYSGNFGWDKWNINDLEGWEELSLLNNNIRWGMCCQPCAILHSCRQTLLIYDSASLARSFTHAGRRCSSEAVPALHDPSLMQADAAHLWQCQPCTMLHSCRQTLIICGSAGLARRLGKIFYFNFDFYFSFVRFSLFPFTLYFYFRFGEILL